jgi:predicted nucleotidyltransferase
MEKNSPAARKLGSMAGEFDHEVAALLDLLPRWARRRPDVRAVALIGSWARRAPRPESDVDVLLLTEEPSLYIEQEDWIRQLGGIAPATTREWGAVTERRFRLPDGREVELGVGSPSWASVTPVDEGTRRVASDGLLALYDPDGLLGELRKHCPPSG